MKKVIAKINGCDLILQYNDKFKDVAIFRISQAEVWLKHWMLESNVHLMQLFEIKKDKN